MLIVEAASHPSALFVILIGALGVLPIILGYTIYAYWIFRARPRPMGIGLAPKPYKSYCLRPATAQDILAQPPNPGLAGQAFHSTGIDRPVSALGGLLCI